MKQNRIRLGLCCIFRQEPIKFRQITARTLLSLSRPDQLERLSEICLHNVQNLNKALLYVSENDFGAFRILSPLLPRYTHPEVAYTLEDLPAGDLIKEEFERIRKFRREKDIRLSFHPDQFNVLSSPRPEVIDNTIRELKYQGILAELVDAEIINLHAGGVYGNKKDSLERLLENVKKIPKSVFSRLSFENDDISYTPADLLPVCEKLKIPMVYDVHHHRCNPDRLTVEEATSKAIATWTNLDREPYFHISSPKYGWQGSSPKPHADYIDPDDFPPCWMDYNITVDIEAKAKELAVLKLMKDLENYRKTMIAELRLTKINLILLTIFAFTLFSGCAYGLDNEKKEGKPAHHSEDGFQNPYVKKKKRGFFKYMKMRYFSKEEFADYESNAHKIPRVQPDLDLIQNPPDALQVTWIGHATILIQYRGINILTDPMFSDRASPISFLGPKRFNPPSVKLKDLPTIDYIVISHSHYDHLDKKTVQQIGSNTKWLVPLGLKQWFVRAGVKEKSAMEFDWWDAKKFKDATITATPAQHWSARSLWDRNKTLWASWMLQIGDKTIWYSGDTGYNPHQFNEIGRKFKIIDLALISIGAYEPRWFMKEMHINPAEAVQIHQDIKSQHSIAVQWGTFQLTSEPIDDPPLKLKKALDRERIPTQEFELLKIGETRVIK